MKKNALNGNNLHWNNFLLRKVTKTCKFWLKNLSKTCKLLYKIIAKTCI